MRCRQVVYMFQNVYACKFNVCYYVFSCLIVVLDCFQAFFASIYFLDFNTAVGIPLLQSNRVAFISNVTMITSFMKPLIYQDGIFAKINLYCAHRPLLNLLP